MKIDRNWPDAPAYYAFAGSASVLDAALEISVITPMRNEAGAAASLIGEIAEALKGVAHEIIAVDDGSADDTVGALRAAQGAYPQLRIITHGQNAGQSRAIRTGVIAARSMFIATIDGDGQNNPCDIPAVWAALREAPPEAAMAAGERRNRQDSGPKKLASSIANGFRRRLLADGAADTGCGLKVFYREAFLRLPYFDHMHRYLPALMQREGYEVVFKPVSHRPRLHGASKYSNLGRLVVAIRDILGVFWLLGRSRSPQTIVELSDSALQPDEDCDKIA